MGHIVLGVGSSHGPSIQTQPEQWEKLAKKDTRDPRFNYQELLQAAKPGLEMEITLDVQRHRYAAAHRALQTLREVIAQAKLDVIVVVSNLHGIRREDPQPVFGVFRGDSLTVAKRSDQLANIEKKFVAGERRPVPKETLSMPGGRDLANHLIDTLIERDFDIACVDQLREGAVLDDAFAFTYEFLLGGAVLPLVPFMLSRDLPNQATPKRCYDLGTALRQQIDAWPADLRVGLIASGGLSHQVIDEDLDRKVTMALVDGDAQALRSLPRAQLNRAPGTPEILNWITVAAAMAPKTMTLVDYLPCYRSAAGTGHGLTFGYWK